MPEFDSLDIFYLAALATVVVVGMMGNGFIVLTNGLAWIQTKTVSPSDMILTTLSLSRLLFLGLLLAVHCLFFRDIDDPKSIPDPLVFLWALANAITLWVATCLAAFYCLKLVNFTQVILVKIKLRLPRLVPRLLLGSVLVSVVLSLPIVCLEQCSPCCNKTEVSGDRNNNSTCPNKLLSGIIYVVGSFPSFIIVLASSVLLIRSLFHHAQKMRQNSGGFKDYRMDVHIKAIKTLVSFVILFTASFVGVVSLAMSTSPWRVIASTTVMALYNSGHSMLLIAMNPKLNQPLIRSLKGAIGCTLRRISSSCHKTARENCSC